MGADPSVTELDRYILITADTHAGADLRGYKPYLAKKWHDDFEGWVGAMEEQQRMFREMSGRASIGVGGDPVADANRNWDSNRRLKEMEDEGVVAEIIFPNTQPPFSPTSSLVFAAPPIGDDLERRWAGLQAHNRWLVDFCGQAPGRRAGIAQIFLPKVDESVKEIHWAAEQGLTGGVLLPGAPPGGGVAPLYAPEYEPIWAACEETAMPVNHHAGSATPDFGMYHPSSTVMFMLEVRWWGHRALWHLMFSGVFERHPELQFVMTEIGSGWVPETLDELDSFYDRMKYGNGSESLFGGPAVESMSLTPSGYFARQCHLGASFLRPNECVLRDVIGIDRIMWGSDYPHTEASYPFTKEHLKLTFAGVDPVEVQQMLAGNAAELYKFDLDALAPLAAKYGPTKTEVFNGMAYAEVPEAAKKCPALAPQNQVQAA